MSEDSRTIFKPLATVGSKISNSTCLKDLYIDNSYRSKYSMDSIPTNYYKDDTDGYLNSVQERFKEDKVFCSTLTNSKQISTLTK